MRNPLPASSESQTIAELRMHLGLRETEIGVVGSTNKNISFDSLDPWVQALVERLFMENFLKITIPSSDA